MASTAVASVATDTAPAAPTPPAADSGTAAAALADTTAPAAAGAGSGSGSGTAGDSSAAAAASATPCVCPGHSRPIVGIHFSPPTPDGVFFVSACLDKKPMLRDGETGDWIGTFEGHKGAVWDTKLNSTATRAATASADFTVKLWDAISGECLHTLQHGHIVKTLAFSPDDTQLATGCNDKILRVYTVADPSEPVTIPHCDQAVRRLLWAADGKHIITGASDGKIRVWNLESASVMKELELSGEIKDLEMSRDGSRITVASGRQVTFLDAKTYDMLASRALDLEVETASLHPSNSDRFVAGGSDLYVRLYETSTGEELACLKGHHGPVHCLRFAPNGASFASGADDGTIRIWPYSEAARSGK